MELSKYIRSIPDYPKKGILFRDITTLIKNKEAFKETIDQLANIYQKLSLTNWLQLNREVSFLHQRFLTIYQNLLF